jgi:tryptophan 2,3-dioxygenase
MNKDALEQILKRNGTSDYETYLNINALFASQTDFSDLCNGDELQFQIVHQMQELLMKLIGYTILNINHCLKEEKTNQALMLFKRVHAYQTNMLTILDLLNTMSPKEYQEIRQKLGNGSGKDSPGFKIMGQVFKSIWQTYKHYYLEKKQLTIEQIYDNQFNYCEAYMIAECLVDFEMQFHRFLFQHYQIVNRSIGTEAKSLNGNDIKKLQARMAVKYFPELWEVRSRMTDHWGSQYGVVREPIK